MIAIGIGNRPFVAEALLCPSGDSPDLPRTRDDLALDLAGISAVGVALHARGGNAVNAQAFCRKAGNLEERRGNEHGGAALIGAAASLLCTVVVGALTFFMKKTLTSLVEADKRNAEDIKALDKNLNDLKADLPLIYVTREDYIRVMNRVEDKLDQILYGGKTKGKEE